MSFDPDAYLAETGAAKAAQPSFDPDSYLAETGASPVAAPASKQPDVLTKPDMLGAAPVVAKPVTQSGFDPDAYLMETQPVPAAKSGFDPDAYLAGVDAAPVEQSAAPLAPLAPAVGAQPVAPIQKIGAGERIRLSRKAETGADASTLEAIGSQLTLGAQPVVDVINKSALQQLASGRKKTFFRGDVPFSELPDYEISNMAKMANLDMPFMDSPLKQWDKTKGAAITDPKMRRAERAKFIQTEATNELKRRLQGKMEAGEKLSKSDQTLWARLAGGAVDNTGYTGAFMRGPVGAVLGPVARRYGDLQTDEQTLVDGKIETTEKGDTQGTAMAKGAAGGSAEYAIEKFGTEAANFILGNTLKRIPGLGPALSKAGGTAAGKVIANVAQKFRKLGEVTGKQNLAGEIFAEELPQQLVDVGLGLNKRESAKLMGIGSDTAEAFKDFVKPENVGNMALEMLLMQAAQGTAASVSYYDAYSKDRNRLDGTLTAFGANPDLVKKASIEEKRGVLKALSDKLTPDKATAILDKLGKRAGDLHDNIVKQEGYDFDANQYGITSRFALPAEGEADAWGTLDDGSKLYEGTDSGIGLVARPDGTATLYGRDGTVEDFKSVAEAADAANKLSVRDQVNDVRRGQKSKFVESTAKRLAPDVNVRVHNTTEDLLEAVPAVKDSPDFEDNPSGIAIGDTIHVVLDNIETPRGVVSTILHEAGVHAGLGRVLKGEAKNQFLGNLGSDAVKKYEEATSKMGYMQGAGNTEEALAYMYEQRLANPTGFQRGISWLHNQLRKVNPNYNFTDSDIEVMLADAQRSVRNAQSGAVTQPAAPVQGIARSAAYQNAKEDSYSANTVQQEEEKNVIPKTETVSQQDTGDLSEVAKSNSEEDVQLWSEAMRAARNDIALADRIFSKWRGEDVKDELDNGTTFEGMTQQESKPNVQFMGNRRLRRDILADGIRPADVEDNPYREEAGKPERKPRRQSQQPDDNRVLFSSQKEASPAESEAREMMRGDRLQRRMDQLSEQSKNAPKFNPIVSVRRVSEKIGVLLRDRWDDMGVEERRTMFDLRDGLNRENVSNVNDALDMFELDLNTRESKPRNMLDSLLDEEKELVSQRLQARMKRDEWSTYNKLRTDGKNVPESENPFVQQFKDASKKLTAVRQSIYKADPSLKPVFGEKQEKESFKAFFEAMNQNGEFDLLQYWHEGRGLFAAPDRNNAKDGMYDPYSALPKALRKIITGRTKQTPDQVAKEIAGMEWGKPEYADSRTGPEALVSDWVYQYNRYLAWKADGAPSLSEIEGRRYEAAHKQEQEDLATYRQKVDNGDVLADGSLVWARIDGQAAKQAGIDPEYPVVRIIGSYVANGKLVYKLEAVNHEVVTVFADAIEGDYGIQEEVDYDEPTRVNLEREDAAPDVPAGEVQGDSGQDVEDAEREAIQGEASVQSPARAEEAGKEGGSATGKVAVRGKNDGSLFDEGDLDFNLDGGTQEDVVRIAAEKKAEEAQQAEAKRKLDAAPMLPMGEKPDDMENALRERARVKALASIEYIKNNIGKVGYARIEKELANLDGYASNSKLKFSHPVRTMGSAEVWNSKVLQEVEKLQNELQKQSSPVSSEDSSIVKSRQDSLYNRLVFGGVDEETAESVVSKFGHTGIQIDWPDVVNAARSALGLNISTPVMWQGSQDDVIGSPDVASHPKKFTSVYNGKEVESDSFQQAAQRVSDNLTGNDHGYVRSPNGQLHEVSRDRKTAVLVKEMRSKEQREIAQLEERIARSKYPNEKAALQKRIDELKKPVVATETPVAETQEPLSSTGAQQTFKRGTKAVATLPNGTLVSGEVKGTSKDGKVEFRAFKVRKFGSKAFTLYPVNADGTPGFKDSMVDADKVRPIDAAADVTKLSPEEQRKLKMAERIDAANADIELRKGNEVAPSDVVDRFNSAKERKEQRKTDNGDVKFRRSTVTPEQDAAYMKAVERGDMETAQGMVDERLTSTGYNVEPVYRGDKTKGVNRINGNRDGFGWFTENPAYAKATAGGGDFRTFRLRAVNMLDLTGDDGNPFVYDWADTFKHPDHDPSTMGKAVYDGELFTLGGWQAQDSLLRFAKARGYDAVRFNSNEDNGIDVVTFDPKQAKLADAVTYDDAGNVIPLSERFNDESSDIRFRRSDASVDKLMEEVNRQAVADNFRALPSTDPKAREIQADVQVSYAYNLTRKTVQRMQDEARGVYEKDKTQAQIDLLAGKTDSGDVNTDARRMAQDKMAVDDLTMDAVANPDDDKKTATAMLGIWRWYERGTDVARALRLRFDPVDTPEGRRAWILRTMLAPTRKEAAIIQRAKTTAEAIDALKIRAKNARKVMVSLKAKNIDISKLTAAELMDEAFVAKIMQEISTARSGWGDMVHEWWRNAILSAPTTQIVNMVGNAGHAALEAFMQRPVEALINTVAKNDRAASMRSVGAMYRAIIPSLNSANKAFLQSWKTEKPVSGDSAKVEESNAAIPTKFGGKIIRTPQRMMMATDEWFKTVFMAMLTADYATREFDRLVKEGKQKESNREDYVLAQVDKDSASYAQAWEETLRWSFQQKPGHMAGAIMNWRNDPTFGFLLKFIFPFVKTPANIISTGIRKTPLNAPFYIYKAATGKYSKEDAFRLGAEQAVGMVFMSLLYGMMEGDDDDPLNRPRITGSKKTTYISPAGEKEAEAQDYPPMSVRVGDKWVSYARLEPFATMTATMVDALTAWKQAKDGKMADIPATLFASIRGNFSDKTFLQGVGNMVSMIEGDEFAISKAATGTLAGFNPNIIRSTVRAFDPYVRDTKANKGFVKKLTYQVMPSEGNATSPKIDKAGQTVKKEGGGVYNSLVPFRVQSADKTTKIDAMVKRYNDGVKKDDRWWPSTPSPITVRLGKEKIELTPEEFETYKRYAGDIAQRRLKSVSFNFDAPTESDMERLKKVYAKARDIAKDKIRPSVIRRFTKSARD